MHRIAAIFTLAATAAAQNVCEAPPAPDVKGATIFSPEQEEILGDVVAQTLSQRIRVYPQAELTAPLERIAARLMQYLPNNPYHFRFFLIEVPEANAFAVPGGRVYVSRRLVAFVENEDELAGVLAHEMGHVVARQGSVEISKAFKQALKVTQVGGRDDIFQKFNQLMDAAGRRFGGYSREREDQGEADRISLRMTWTAGYDIQAVAHFFDRLTENKGATGNFFSDLFGVTRPESKRLREMIRGIEAIPAECRKSRQAGEKEKAEFQAWRKTVAELSREDLRAVRSDLVPALRLAPRMRPELIHLKFSPDGKLMIAQDGAGINVLRREPLAYLFRIPALEAHAATFDRESRRILIPGAGSRLEIWNVESRERERLWEPAESEHCDEIAPSPDGRFAACLVGIDEIRLVEIGSNTEVAKHRFEVNWLVVLFAALSRENTRPLHAEFSPDGKTFLAATAMTMSGPESWAFDLVGRSQFSAGKPLKGSLGPNFSFIAADRIAAVHPYDFRQSGLYSWPDGKLVEKFALPPFPISAATSGTVLLLRPFREYAGALLDLKAKEIFQVSHSPAMDRFAEFGAGERGTGEVSIYAGRKTEAIATLQLPEAELGRLRAGVHSPDLEWLALSLENRGAIWNLKTGKASLLKPFDGGSISAAGAWTTTFEDWRKQPEQKGFKRVHMRATLDLPRAVQVGSTDLAEPDKGKTVKFAGKYEVTLEDDRHGKNGAAFTVKDVVADRILWTREMKSAPFWHLGDSLVLEWWPGEKGAEQVFKEMPELKRKRDRLKSSENVSLVEVVELETGKSLGHVLFEAGGRLGLPREVHVAGRTLFMEDSRGRTLAYSMDTGDRAGQQFGRVLGVNAARGLAAVQNQPGVVEVFDSAMRKVTEYTLPGNVIYAGFDGEGKRLLAVTGAQEVFVEEVPK